MTNFRGLAFAGSLREDDIYRVMRMLVSFNIFSAIPPKGDQPALFRNNAASAALREDHPNSVKHIVSQFGTLVQHFLELTSHSHELFATQKEQDYSNNLKQPGPAVHHCAKSQAKSFTNIY